MDRLAIGLADLAPADREGGGEEQPPNRKHACRDQALIQRAHDRIVESELFEIRSKRWRPISEVIVAELDEIGARDRRDDAEAADGQRINHGRGKHRLAGEEDRGENHGGDNGHGVGLEQIGRHARAIANIVADVVGDGRGVARIILWNAGLDLADEIGADISALGEDAAAKSREDRNQRSAKAQRHQRVHDSAVRRAYSRRTK